jgi:hypothetical protein
MTTKARIVSVTSAPDGAVVRLTLADVEAPPLAPGWLGWTERGGEQCRLVVHRLLEQSGDLVTLESLEAWEWLPIVGAEVSYTSWWTPDQLRLVTNTSRQWTAVRIDQESVDRFLTSPNNESVPTTDPPEEIDYCDFCGLCWERIAGEGLAYRSDRDWVCSACYDKYIDGDFLGLRTKP